MQRATLAADIQIRFIATLKTPFKFSPDICRARPGLNSAFPVKPNGSPRKTRQTQWGLREVRPSIAGHPGST
jgi:hypothetical protein